MNNSWLRWPPSRKQAASFLFVTFLVVVITEWQLVWVKDVWLWFATSSSSTKPQGDETTEIIFDSGASIIRNLGLLAVGILALSFAWWRAKIADRQATAAQATADTAQATAEVAQATAETAQRTLLNDQYQKATELLGNSNLAIRLGGIDQLHRIGRGSRDQYYVQVMQLLCAFVRFPTDDANVRSAQPGYEITDSMAGRPTLRPDVQLALSAIAERTEEEVAAQKAASFELDLSGADLRNSFLARANLSHAILRGAKLSGSMIAEADLSDAGLGGADLSSPAPAAIGLSTATSLVYPLDTDIEHFEDQIFDDAFESLTWMEGTDLSRATLTDANLAGVALVEALLPGAILRRANLEGADLSGAHLANANLRYAKLRGANLTGTSMDGADLFGADLTGVYFSGSEFATTGLTEEQLRHACAEPSDPPKLDGVVDAGNGQDLGKVSWIWSPPSAPPIRGLK